MSATSERLYDIIPAIRHQKFITSIRIKKFQWKALNNYNMSPSRPLRRKPAQAPALDAPPRVTFSGKAHDYCCSGSIVENIFQDNEFNQYIDLVNLYRKTRVLKQIDYPRVWSSFWSSNRSLLTILSLLSLARKAVENQASWKTWQGCHYNLHWPPGQVSLLRLSLFVMRHVAKWSLQ